MKLNFKKIFDDHAESNKKTWAHDRTQTVGASEAFQCIRRTYFSKTGAEPDAGFEQSFGATSRGTLLENHYVVPAVRENLPKGATALWLGDEQITLVEGRISATPDGLITGLARDALKDYGIADIESDCILLEIKSIDPRINLSEAKPVHAGQVQQQLGLVHEKTNHRPEYAVVLYVNASWVDDIRIFPIKRDPQAYEVCKKRAAMVYAAEKAADLPAEGKLGGGSECDYCPFAKQCQRASVGSIPAKDESDVHFTPKEEKELRGLVKRDRDVRERIGELELMKTEVAEQIKDFLRRHKKRFGKTSDGYSASYSSVSGRKSYDIARLAQDAGLDLEDYATYGEPSEKLTTKGPKA